MGNSNRIKELDFAKGLGMLTVIWAHIIDVGYSHILIYSFHMPLFIFISGMVYNKNRYNSLSDLLKRRLKTMLLPYFVFSFLTWIIWVGFSIITNASVDSYWMPLVQTFIAQGSQGYLVHNVPLWFVTCLLVIEVLYYFLSRYNDRIIILGCVLSAIISYLMGVSSTGFDFTTLPWNFGVALAGIIFYAFGNLIFVNGLYNKARKWINGHKTLAFAILALMTVILFVSAMYNGKLTMGHEQYGKSRLLFYINAFIGIACVLIFSVLLNDRNNNKGVLTRIVDGCSWIGENCIYFLLLENPIKGFVVVVFSKLIGINEDVFRSRFELCLPAFAISLIITIVAVWIILWAKRRLSKIKL